MQNRTTIFPNTKYSRLCKLAFVKYAKEKTGICGQSPPLFTAPVDICLLPSSFLNLLNYIVPYKKVFYN